MKTGEPSEQTRDFIPGPRVSWDTTVPTFRKKHVYDFTSGSPNRSQRATRRGGVRTPRCAHTGVHHTRSEPYLCPVPEPPSILFPSPTLERTKLETGHPFWSRDRDGTGTNREILTTTLRPWSL